MQLESARASFANASAVVHSGHLPTSPGLVLPQEQVVAEGAVAEVETPLQAEVVDSLKRCSTRNTQKKKENVTTFGPVNVTSLLCKGLFSHTDGLVTYL